MAEELKCVVCGNDAVYITKNKKEPLCEKCAAINEGIKRSKIIRRR